MCCGNMAKARSVFRIARRRLDPIKDNVLGHIRDDGEIIVQGGRPAPGRDGMIGISIDHRDLSSARSLAGE